jgi:hypothetical protein
MSALGKHYLPNHMYADSLATLGWIQHQLGKHESAIGYLTAAVQLGPPPLSSWKLAVALDAAGKPEQAAPWFRTAIDESPWLRPSLPERLRESIDTIAPAMAKGGWRAIVPRTSISLPAFREQEFLFGVHVAKDGSVKEVIPATDDTALIGEVSPAIRSLVFPTVTVGAGTVSAFYIVWLSVDPSGAVSMVYSCNAGEVYLLGMEIARKFFEQPR